MNLTKISIGLSLSVTIGYTFSTVPLNAQTIVSEVSRQQELRLPFLLASKGKAQKSKTATTQTSAVFFISEEQAHSKVSPVRIFPGRTSIIDFRNHEKITFIRLANQERIVYYTNAPVESGQARLITLNLTAPLPFEGQTRPPGFGQHSSSATNLVVSTINSSGEHNSYIFDLVPATGNPTSSDRNGVAIVPQDSPEITLPSVAQSTASRATSTIQTNLGLATLTDIKRGLRVSLVKKYSDPNDPIIFQVEECLAKARNGVPLLEAAKQMGVPLSVIISLGEIGIADEIRTGNTILPSTLTERTNSGVVKVNQQPNHSTVPTPKFGIPGAN